MRMWSVRHQMERWQVQPFTCALLYLAHCESEQFTHWLNPTRSGFFSHWNKIQCSCLGPQCLCMYCPHSLDSSSPKYPRPSLPFSTPLAIPLSLFPHHRSSLTLKTQRKWGLGSTSYSYLWFLFSRAITFYFVILGFFVVVVIYFRFVGEKRAPQKKVLSWRRQRMQESRCQSRSMNSQNPEISTTTCAGPRPPGSGILRSRCASFYSKTHPHSS